MQHGACGLDHGPDFYGRRRAEFGETAADRVEAFAAIATSSAHQGVSRPLVRIKISRLPNPLAAIAAAMPSRASALASGATESTRSRIRPSAARLRAFSSARGLEPGMNRWLRRGRVMRAFLPVP